MTNWNKFAYVFLHLTTGLKYLKNLRYSTIYDLVKNFIFMTIPFLNCHFQSKIGAKYLRLFHSTVSKIFFNSFCKNLFFVMSDFIYLKTGDLGEKSILNFSYVFNELNYSRIYKLLNI